MPGLIDAHVHAESDDDLENDARLGRHFRAPDGRGRRRRKVAGVGVPGATAHSRRLSGSAHLHGEGRLVGSGRARGHPRRPVSGDAGRRAVARCSRAKELGASEIKLMLDDMGWCRDPKPRFPGMAPPVAAALLSEAAKLGMRATVHAPNLSDAKEAIAGGATALAHGVLDPIDDATIAAMKRRPVFYIPTMDIFEFLADTRAFVDRVLSDPAVTAIEPASEEDRRAIPLQGVFRRLPGALSELRERGATSPDAPGEPPSAARRRRARGARHRHVGFPGARSARSRWTSTCTPGCPRSTPSAPRPRPRPGRSESRRTAARSKPGSAPTSWCCSANPLEDVRNVRRISAIYKRGASA